MLALDELAARAVCRARLLERAIHDPGPWVVALAGLVVPAVRVIDEESRTVTFHAEFLVPASGVAELRCGGEPVSWRDVKGLPDGFEVEWSLAYCDPVAA